MAIILALKRNQRMTANALARMFEVDIRTIYRDIQALSEMNVPIVSQSGPEGGYSILGEYFISPIIFNKEEIFALMMSRKAIVEAYTPGYYEYIESAFLKIENVMKLDDTKGLQILKERVMFEKTSKTNERKEYSFFELIKKGLEDNIKINIKEFYSQDMKDKTDIIHPYGLLHLDNDWVTICFSELKGAINSLHMSDIKEAEFINESYVMPEDFDIQQYYCKNHCIMKCTDNGNKIVKIKVNKEGYYRIKDYIFFHKAEVVEVEDGYILTNQVSDPGCYVDLAFKFYDIIEILEPKCIKDEVLSKLNNLIKIYKDY